MRQVLVVPLLAALAVVMIAGVLGLPTPGSADAPAHTHVSARYVADGAEDTGVRNLVTAVLLHYRALDTFGEVVVIFAALLGVLAVTSLSTGTTPPAAGHAEPSGSGGPGPASAPGTVAVSPIVSLVVRLMAPFIAAFGLFVIVEGHVLPGGGFQGGVVLGAMLILLTIVRGREAVAALVPESAVFWVRAAAPLTFGLIAVTGMGVSGWMFGMPEQPLLREAMTIALELGIGIGSAAALIGLFLVLNESGDG